MVKSHKKQNRLAELAKGLQEQRVQEQHSLTSELQQSSIPGRLFQLAEKLVEQAKTQPQTSHLETTPASSSAKTSKLFALNEQLHSKQNQPSKPQLQSEVSQAQSFDGNEPIVLQSRDRETAEAFDWNEPIVLESPDGETAEAFDWNESIVLEFPDREPDPSELSTAQAVQPLPLGSYLLESLENPTQAFTVEPFESFQPPVTSAVDTQLSAETVPVVLPSAQAEATSEPFSSPPLTQTQVIEPKSASSEPVTKVSPPVESPEPDGNAGNETMLQAITQQPVTADSEEPQPPMDAKTLAMELLNILQAKQAGQAQNQSPAAVLGLETQDAVRSNPSSQATEESQPVPATAISSFDELDKRLEADRQREEAISSAPRIAEAPLKPTTAAVSPFDELNRRMEKEKQQQEAIAQAQAVTEPEAKPVAVTVLPAFDELDKRLEKEKQQKKAREHQQALTEPDPKTVTVTVISSFDELDKRLEAEKQESIPVVSPDSKSNSTAQIPVEPKQDLPPLDSSRPNTSANVQAVLPMKVEIVESQVVAMNAEDESHSLGEVFEDFDRRLDSPELEQSNTKSAITAATAPNSETQRKPEKGEVRQVQPQLTMLSAGNAVAEASSEREGDLQPTKSSEQPLLPIQKEPMVRAFEKSLTKIHLENAQNYFSDANLYQCKGVVGGGVNIVFQNQYKVRVSYNATEKEDYVETPCERKEEMFEGFFKLDLSDLVPEAQGGLGGQISGIPDNMKGNKANARALAAYEIDKKLGAGLIGATFKAIHTIGKMKKDLEDKLANQDNEKEKNDLTKQLKKIEKLIEDAVAASKKEGEDETVVKERIESKPILGIVSIATKGKVITDWTDFNIKNGSEQQKYGPLSENPIAPTKAERMKPYQKLPIDLRKQLSNLYILDAILGMTDRGTNNFHVTEIKEIKYKVIAIDNDDILGEEYRNVGYGKNELNTPIGILEKLAKNDWRYLTSFGEINMEEITQLNGQGILKNSNHIPQSLINNLQEITLKVKALNKAFPVEECTDSDTFKKEEFKMALRCIKENQNLFEETGILVKNTKKLIEEKIKEENISKNIKEALKNIKHEITEIESLLKPDSFDNIQYLHLLREETLSPEDEASLIKLRVKAQVLRGMHPTDLPEIDKEFANLIIQKLDNNEFIEDVKQILKDLQFTNKELNSMDSRFKSVGDYLRSDEAKKRYV